MPDYIPARRTEPRFLMHLGLDNRKFWLVKFGQMNRPRPVPSDRHIHRLHADRNTHIPPWGTLRERIEVSDDLPKLRNALGLT